MAVGGYRSVDVVNPRRGYREPFVVITQTPNYKYDHFVRPNRVVLKYPNLKKG
jgi:hypothetical protein